MRKLFYLLIITLFTSACSKSPSTTDNTEVTTEPPSAKLDSIDNANNESIVASGDDVRKAFVFLNGGDSTISLVASMNQDHRFFGYAEPDTKSERLILFSIFTNDVENNPFGCKFGAYYDTSGMTDLVLKYVSTNGDFIQATATDKSNTSTTLYFESKWVAID